MKGLTLDCWIKVKHNAGMDVSYLKGIFCGILCIGVVGCAVGPDFYPLPPPCVTRYTMQPLPQKTAATPGVTGGKSQTLAYNEAIPALWWNLFHSPELDRLIRLGLANNPSLTAAQAAIRVAQQNLRAGEGAFFPSVNLNGAMSRQRQTGINFGAPGIGANIFNVYTTSVNASYLLDIFGGIRRQVEALGAQVDFQVYEWQATYLTLTSNIVISAINEAALRELITATQHLIKVQTQQVEILKNQYQLGGVSLVEVSTIESQLGQTRATLPPLQKQLAQTRDALAVLVGALPSRIQLPKFYLHHLVLPKSLPLSVPSALVEQRPDVQAAQALVHAASAQIGVATANMLPQITLVAGYGWSAPEINQLFQTSTSFWNYAAQLAQPIFQGGTLLAKRRAAIAAYDEALAKYQQTVLQAFQDVADALEAVHADAKTLQAEAVAERAAQETLYLTQQQFDLGAVNSIALLIANSQYQQTLINRIRAEADRYKDSAALLQALGGTWAGYGKKEIGKNV